VKDEQELKLKYNIGLCKSDFILKGKNIIIALSLGFISSSTGQIFGFGGAFIFNPAQIFLGISPVVAAETSQYIFIFTNSQATTLFIIFGKLNYQYTLWLMLYSGLGVFIGLCSMKWYIKNYKRPSIIAFAQFGILVASIIFSSTHNLRNLLLKKQNGIDVFQGDPIC
jgi:uncharacterized membrane protein YfcA